MKSTEMLVVEMLTLAVPLWQMRAFNSPWSRVEQRMLACQETLNEFSEYFSIKGEKKGQSKAAFNAVAEALAILSYSPGGIHFLGMHWQAPAHPDLAKDS